MQRLKETLKLKGKRIERVMVIALAGLVGVLSVASKNAAGVFIGVSTAFNLLLTSALFGVLKG